MDYIYLYVVDAFLIFGVIYGCCSKINHQYDIDIDNDAKVYIPLKNENNLSYEEIDIEALYN